MLHEFFDKWLSANLDTWIKGPEQGREGYSFQRGLSQAAGRCSKSCSSAEGATTDSPLDLEEGLEMALSGPMREITKLLSPRDIPCI